MNTVRDEQPRVKSNEMRHKTKKKTFAMRLGFTTGLWSYKLVNIAIGHPIMSKK